jgi:Fungal specific transcription factor domain
VKSRRAVRQVPVSTRDTASAYQQQPLSASLIGNKLEIYISYSRKFLRRGGAIDLALQEVPLGDMITAGTAAANSQIFHQAFLSFALITFGSQHRQSQITDRGYAIYGVAVRQLNQALSDSNRHTDDDVFISVVTLAFLECFVPTGPKHYIKHMIALERLLELRNPSSSSYCNPKSSEFYKSVRHMILFASLRTGQPSILARAEWKIFLRAQCSEEEFQGQDLFDILADCTVLIAERDKMLANWELDLGKSTHQRDKIKRRAITLLSYLRAWKERWDGDGRNSYSETPIINDNESWGDRSPPSFLTVFKFSNASSAAMLMFCNTTLIYVLRVLVSLPLLPGSLGLLSSQSIPDTLQDVRHLDNFWRLGKDEYLAAERLAALEVCRCIPFDLAQNLHLGSCVSPISHWAVATAWTTLGGIESANARWMMDLLNTNGPEGIAKGVWDR